MCVHFRSQFKLKTSQLELFLISEQIPFSETNHTGCEWAFRFHKISMSIVNWFRLITTVVKENFQIRNSIRKKPPKQSVTTVVNFRHNISLTVFAKGHCCSRKFLKESFNFINLRKNTYFPGNPPRTAFLVFVYLQVAHKLSHRSIMLLSRKKQQKSV